MEVMKWDIFPHHEAAQRLPEPSSRASRLMCSFLRECLADETTHLFQHVNQMDQSS